MPDIQQSNLVKFGQHFLLRVPYCSIVGLTDWPNVEPVLTDQQLAAQIEQEMQDLNVSANDGDHTENKDQHS